VSRATPAPGSARAFAHVKIPLAFVDGKGVTEVSLDTHAVGQTVCVTFDPAVVTITPDTTVMLTPDYSGSADGALFAFRRPERPSTSP
jgi:hypothetical protein